MTAVACDAKWTSLFGSSSQTCSTWPTFGSRSPSPASAGATSTQWPPSRKDRAERRHFQKEVRKCAARCRRSLLLSTVNNQSTKPSHYCAEASICRSPAVPGRNCLTKINLHSPIQGLIFFTKFKSHIFHFTIKKKCCWSSEKENILKQAGLQVRTQDLAKGLVTANYLSVHHKDVISM